MGTFLILTDDSIKHFVWKKSRTYVVQVLTLENIKLFVKANPSQHYL